MPDVIAYTVHELEDRILLALLDLDPGDAISDAAELPWHHTRWALENMAARHLVTATPDPDSGDHTWRLTPDGESIATTVRAISDARRTRAALDAYDRASRYDRWADALERLPIIGDHLRRALARPARKWRADGHNYATAPLAEFV